MSEPDAEKPEAIDVKKTTLPTKKTANVSGAAAKKNATRTSGRAKAEIKTAKHPFLWTLTILNLGLFVGLAIAGYFAWQQWQLFQSNQQASIAAIEHKVQSSLQQQLKQQNNALKDNLQPIQQQVQNQLEQIQFHDSRLIELSGRRPSDWLLAEADYLVRMAGRKLWLEKDAATAISLLNAANARLQDMQDPSLIPVRSLIAEDIQVLQQINVISATEIALEISALSAQVDSLKLSMVHLPDPASEPISNELTESLEDWKSNLKKTWDNIADDFIRIERRTDQVKPSLNEQQQWLVKERLKYQLSVAQSALLKEQFELYKQALSDVKTMLVAYFDESLPASIAFSQTLDNLLGTDAAVNYPSALSSAQELQNILHMRTGNVTRSTKTEPAL